MLRFAIALLTGFFMVCASAQAEEERAILVLDGSGSMWGQIGGRHKIEIAREVIAEVLADTPADRQLGLVAYGHNRKGDCRDIEQLAEVGADRGDISRAVNRINPRGKTPLSDAVIFAAEKLKYQEEAATVILVSDGIETCKADPCAVGKALEEAGVNFTVHVVGFDIDDPKAIAQLQCMAETTGGQYFSASNASELGAALTTTVAAAPATPDEPSKPGRLRMVATELEHGPTITEGLVWRVTQAGGGETVFTSDPTGEAEIDLPAGAYDVFVSRAAGNQAGEEKVVTLNPGADKTVSIALDVLFDVSLRTAPEGEAPVNTDLVVYWEGPDRKGDYIAIAEPGSRASKYLRYTYTSRGQPLALRMPTDPGDYEVRYILGQPPKMLASIPLRATEVGATLQAPDEVGAGSNFNVAWTGPGGQGDWITIVKPDARENAYKSYAYPKQDVLTLTAPLESGDYELRYVLAGKRIINRRPIRVIDVDATVSGPPEAAAGTEIEVAWTGAAERSDLVTIAEPKAKPGKYIGYFYPKKDDAPGKLKMPLEPGKYELRYVQGGKNILAAAPIEITAVAASLTAPGKGAAGDAIEVSWTGPDTKGDFVTLTRDGRNLSKSGAYFYTSRGDPGKIVLPLEPGIYGLRYLQNGKKELAATTIEVTDVEASLQAPESGVEGEAIQVAWTGPNAKGDFVSIARNGKKGTGSGAYFYTKRDNPGDITLPLDAGDYELIYWLGGDRPIATTRITVTPASATLSAEAEVIAEAPLSVDWTGPGGHRDLLVIARPDQKPSKYVSYAYARNGAPARIRKAPKEPGEYELRYLLAGKKAIATRPITVAPGE